MSFNDLLQVVDRIADSLDRAAASASRAGEAFASVRQSRFSMQMQKANEQTYTSTDGAGNPIGFGGIAAGDLMTQFENYIRAVEQRDIRGQIQLRAFLEKFGANLFGNMSFKEFLEQYNRTQRGVQAEFETRARNTVTTETRAVAQTVRATATEVVSAMRIGFGRVEQKQDEAKQQQEKAVDEIGEKLRDQIEALSDEEKATSLQRRRVQLEEKEYGREAAKLDELIAEKKKEAERLKNRVDGQADRRLEIEKLERRRAEIDKRLQELDKREEELEAMADAIRDQIDARKLSLDQREFDLKQKEKAAADADEKRTGTTANKIDQIYKVITGGGLVVKPTEAQQAVALRVGYLTGAMK